MVKQYALGRLERGFDHHQSLPPFLKHFRYIASQETELASRLSFYIPLFVLVDTTIVVFSKAATYFRVQSMSLPMVVVVKAFFFSLFSSPFLPPPPPFWRE